MQLWTLLFAIGVGQSRTYDEALLNTIILHTVVLLPVDNDVLMIVCDHL